MNIWENTVLTDQGKALQAKLLQGQTLKITRVTTGTKKVPVVDLRQQTDITEGGYDITLQPSRTEGEQTILPVLLENTGLKESHDLWQVGFFAEDPDEEEILFCISQASQAKHIPSEAESPGYSVTWDFCFSTSNTVPFEVVLNSNGLVNIEAYQAHTDAIHKVNGKIDGINSSLEYKKVSCTTTSLTGTAFIEKSGCTVSLVLRAEFAQNIEQYTNGTICTIPEEFRPKVVSRVFNGYSGGLSFYCVIDIDGTVKIQPMSGKYSAGSWIYGSFTYIVE
ncbi:hypothetical protein [Anaerostipes sp.]|uniref:hypothetical protein n=1 Tax=Anaerostipes sp. TaxID=1872530 RepID=UPI0025C169FD|nr:hypothetical protein [Anaerostipes sp.]